jgi:23S rRNA-/tRNA-specific pseudouridylate synthase
MGSQRENQIEKTFFTKRWRWSIADGESHASMVEEELAHRLPHIDPKSWGTRFGLGGAYMNRVPVELGVTLATPCVLEYYEPHFAPEKAADFFPVFSADMVLYADDDLAVVFKPAGLPSTPPRDIAHFNLQSFAGKFFERSVHLPSRLDVAVSGLVLVSFSSRMHRYCQKAQSRSWIEKYYLAEVVGVPEWSEIDVILPLGRDSEHPVLRAVRMEDGQFAHTRLRALTSTPAGRAYVQAMPVTGRTHQIRVHCAALSYPIVGDPYYGELGPEVRLASFGLRFFHPYRKEPLTFCIPGSLRPDWLSECVNLVGEQEAMRPFSSGVSK